LMNLLPQPQIKRCVPLLFGTEVGGFLMKLLRLYSFLTY